VLQKLTDYISWKKDEWKSDLFKEPRQKWYFLPLLVFSVAAICWGVYDYPTNPDTEDISLMLTGVCGGIAGLLESVAELLPKSQTQLTGILRTWAIFAATLAAGAVALQFLPLS
jgi:hypothetical protein